MAEPAGVLIKAIVAAFNGDSSLDDINGPHLHEKPPDSSVGFPYCAIDHISSAILGETCQSQLWEHFIDFVVHHRTPELTNTQLDLIDAAFSSDSLSLSLSDGELWEHRLVNSQYAQADKEVEEGLLSYRFRTRRDRIA